MKHKRLPDGLKPHQWACVKYTLRGRIIPHRVKIVVSRHKSRIAAEQFRHRGERVERL